MFATGLKVTWVAPLNDGGSPITNYIVDKRETSRANWAQVSSKVMGEVLEIAVERLIEAHEYQFRIRAENTFGVGEPILTKPVTTKNPFSKNTLIYVYSVCISMQCVQHCTNEFTSQN